MDIKGFFKRIQSLFKNKTVIRVSIIVLALILVATVVTVIIVSSSSDGESAYTVVFNTNGADSIPSQSVTRGKRITPPRTPTRDGFIFDGWYFNGVLWSFDYDTVEQNMILDAVWCEAVTVSFDSGEEIYDVLCAKGRALNAADIPQISDPDFGGWYYGGVAWDLSAPMDADITLRAAMRTQIGIDIENGKFSLTLPHGGTKPLIDSISDATLADIVVSDSGASLIISNTEDDGDGRVDLLDYMKYMPHLSDYLSKNPSLTSAITSADGGIYFVPSRTGYGALGYLPFVRADIIRELLDGDDAFKPEDTDRITARISPFITDISSVAVIGESGDVEMLRVRLSVSGNVLDNFNAFSDLGELDGELAARILREYIDSAYGGYYGTERSVLFLGDGSAYNTDELVALMICAASCYDILAVSVDGEDGLVYLMASLFGISDIDAQRKYINLSDGMLEYRGTDEGVSSAVYRMNYLISVGLVGFGERDCLIRYTSVFEDVDNGFVAALPAVSVRETLEDETVSYTRVTSMGLYDMTSAFSIPTSAVTADGKALHAALRLIDYLYSDECIRTACESIDGICTLAAGDALFGARLSTLLPEHLGDVETLCGGDASAYMRDYVGAGLITPPPAVSYSRLTDEQQNTLRSIERALRLLE